jgi:hypothetical protein
MEENKGELERLDERINEKLNILRGIYNKTDYAEGKMIAYGEVLIMISVIKKDREEQPHKCCFNDGRIDGCYCTACGKKEEGELTKAINEVSRE